MIHVRRAVRSDLEAILPLLAGYRAFYEQKLDARREREFMRDRLDRATSVVFVACSGESVVGFAQLFELGSGVSLATEFLLADLFVAPSARRMGAARLLLDQAVRFAAQSGASGMFLETAHDNVSAQAAYEGAGWTREKRFVKYNAVLGSGTRAH